MRASAFVLVTLIAAGCTTAAMNLERASARAIQPTPNPDSVRVSEIHKGILMSRWVATTADGVYDCSLAADEKTAICARRSTPR